MDIFNVAKTVSITRIAQDIHGLDIQQQGGRLVAVCPFHADSDPSCFFDEEKNVFKCFGCDAAGSGIDYVMQAGLAGEPKDAATYIVQRWGLGEPAKSIPLKNNKENRNTPKKKHWDTSLSLEQYAQDKALPVEFLKTLGLENKEHKVFIPYRLEDGSPGPCRKRQHGNKDLDIPNFLWVKGSKLCLYGLDRLKDYSNDYIILVEGESDSQTLWLHSYPCLGVPGARNFKEVWVKHLLRFKQVYLHKEPDEAGQLFVQRIISFLQKAEYSGEILVFSIPNYKDPNELHKASPTHFNEIFKTALTAAYAPTSEELPSTAEPDNPIRTADDVIALVEENPGDVFTEHVLGALAMMKTRDQARVKTELKGKVPLRDLNKAIQETKRELKMHLRVVKQGEEPERPSLCEMLEDCSLDIPVPDGWQISEQGVFEIVNRQNEFGQSSAVERRFPVPVVLASVLQPLDTADEGVSYEVAWMNGNWHRNAFPAEVVFDRSKLTSTAAVGMPVDSENSKGLLRWMAALRDTREIPTKKIVTRCGWHKNDQIFVLGKNVICKDTDDKADDEDVHAVGWTPSVRKSEFDLVEAIHAKGEKDAQVDLILETIQQYPLAGFLIGASAAAPLLRFLYASGHLEIHGFVVEVVSDQAGIGKSTGNELAASIWGNPGKLARTFDRTSVAWEILLHTMCDCPVFLEEAQLASKENIAAKLVYALGLGMGRERGSRNGGLRTTKQFFNTALVASEQSLKVAAAREGIEARVITLPPVFGDRDPEKGKELRKLRTAYFSHYGHMGQAYIQYLLDSMQEEAEKEAVVDLYNAMLSNLEEQLPSSADGEMVSTAIRMATRVASCWLGLHFLLRGNNAPFGEAIRISEPCVMTAWNHIVKNLDTAPLWKRALAVIQSWAAENVHRIAGMEAGVESYSLNAQIKAPPNYIGGLVQTSDVECVGFLPNAFDEAIKKHLDIESKEIRSGLVREGIILPDSEGRTTRSQRISPSAGSSFKTRVICIPKEYIFPDSDDSQSDDSFLFNAN